MIEKKTIRTGLLWSGFIVALMLVVSVWALGKLPAGAQIPVHFGPDGTPDRYGSRFEGLFLLPLVTIGVALLMAVLPKIEPRRTNFLQSHKAYVAFWLVIMFVLAGVHGAAVGNAVGYDINVTIIVLTLVGAMFIVIGNFLGKIKSNFTMGVRTPWTLTSNLSWNKTHRLVGKLFVALGVTMVLGGFVAPPIVMVWIVIAGSIGAIAVAAPYSYIVWRSDPDKSTQGREDE